VNTALADQLQAAARDARSLVADAAEHFGGGPDWAAPPAWLTHHLQRIQIGSLTGAVRFCPHVSSSPEVVWSAVWRPGEVWCARCCRDAMLAVRGTAEDAVCDGCRRPARPIFSVMTAAGALMVAAGLCRDCRSEVQAVAE
jgi:hypothetical protein